MNCITITQVNYIPICNIWLNPAEHVNGGLVDLKEHTIEDLQKQRFSTVNNSSYNCQHRCISHSKQQMKSKKQLIDQPTCLKRRSCKIFFVFGCMALILQ
jgi:hypothetical protein